MKLILEDTLSEQCPLPTPLKDKLGSVIFIAGLFLVSFVARAIFSPLMPQIEKDLGIGHREAGGFFLIISLGFLLVPFLIGWISSRYNHRRTSACISLAHDYCPVPVRFRQGHLASKDIHVHTWCRLRSASAACHGDNCRGSTEIGLGQSSQHSSERWACSD